MKVRWKLVAILLVPLAALIGVSVYGINQRLTDARTSDNVRRLTQLASAVTTALHDLQTEAGLSAWYVSTVDKQGADELQAARVATDNSVAALHTTIAHFDGAAFGPDLAKTLSLTDARLDTYKLFRESVDRRGADGTSAVEQYRLQGDSLLEVTALVADRTPDPELKKALTAYLALSRAKQASAAQLSLMAQAVGVGHLESQAYQELNTAQFNESTQLAVFQSLATPEEKQLYRHVVAGSTVDQTATMVDRVVAAGASAPILADIKVWMASSTDKQALTRKVEQQIETDIVKTASDRKAAADRDVFAYGLLTLATAVFAMLAASVVGRAITRPLRRLAKAANEVADEQLPGLVEALRNPKADGSAPDLHMTPVVRTSRDEVGDLAEAFASIQRVAVDVAVEQANLLRKGIGELFVNLARRNQSLLDRQIGFLDQLEAAETDPDALENLFKLDHLATRMRRNAESLLVLAGIEAPRRWGKPVPLGDVVRAAVGEVEDYSRVHVSALDDVLVLGNAAADVAHLLSELLDNATQFSAPGTRVEVIGRRKPDGYLVSVSDLGIGMGGAQLAEANELLAHPPVTGLSLSRSLGFIVVGRLANRYGIHIELSSTAVGGVTALVDLPASLITETASAQARPEAEEPATMSLLSIPRPTPPAGPLVTGPEKGHAWSRDDAPDAVWNRIVDPPLGVSGHGPSAWDEPSVVSDGAWSHTPLNPEPASAAPSGSSTVELPGGPSRWSDIPAEPVAPKPEPAPTAEHRPQPPAEHPSETPSEPLQPLPTRVKGSTLGPVPTLAEAVPHGTAFESGLASISSPAVVPPSAPTEGYVPPVVSPAPPAPKVDPWEKAYPSTSHPSTAHPSTVHPSDAGTTPSGLPRRRGSDHDHLPSSAVGGDALHGPMSGPFGPASTPLPRRSAGGRSFGGPTGLAGLGNSATASHRSPEEIRSLLSSYRSGLDRGRTTGSTDAVPRSGAQPPEEQNGAQP